MPLPGNICQRIIVLTLFVTGSLNTGLAQTITGQVTDAEGRALPFATIKFGNTKQGVIANLNGKFFK